MALIVFYYGKNLENFSITTIGKMEGFQIHNKTYVSKFIKSS